MEVLLQYSDSPKRGQGILPNSPFDLSERIIILCRKKYCIYHRLGTLAVIFHVHDCAYSVMCHSGTCWVLSEVTPSLSAVFVVGLLDKTYATMSE